MPNRHWGYTPVFFPHNCVRQCEGFFPAGLVQKNLSDSSKWFCIMAYFCYPLARLFYLRHPVLSPCFQSLLIIRFISGCGQLPFNLAAANRPSLCVVSLLLSMSLCANICGARNVNYHVHYCFVIVACFKLYVFSS